MRFREDIDHVMQRVTAFAEGKRHALIHVLDIEGLETAKVPPLEAWSLPGDWRSLLDAQFAGFALYWKQRTDIADDLIPAITPHYGIAEHSAFVGGDVSFGGNTSYHHAVVRDYAKDFGKLRLDENNVWLRLVLDGLSYLIEKADGLCAVKVRGGESPMDMANAVRGNALFADLYEEEEWARRLLSFCVDALKFTMERQMKTVGPFRGGYIGWSNAWMPGHAFGHLSEDASCLCSPAHYLAFGKPYTEAAIEALDTVMIHTHTLGRHALPAICSIEKLGFIDILRDPNQPAPIDVLREYGDVLRGKAVQLPVTADELRHDVDLLRGHRVILSYHAKSAEDARWAVSFVRDML